MVWKRAAGVIVAGTLLAGCAQHPKETPKASAIVPPMDESAVAGLEQSWRSAHPGSLVGHVNAVDPGRHVLSVTGLPMEQVHNGDVISILLDGQGNSVVPARVYDHRDGFVQMDYGPLQAGQGDPQQGNLAVWFSSGPTAADQAAPAGVSTPMPTTQPGAAAPEMTAPPAAPPPAAAVPQTTPLPAAPSAAAPPPADASTPPATAPASTPAPPADNKLPSDLNK
jgi:hypothetical protein